MSFPKCKNCIHWNKVIDFDETEEDAAFGVCMKAKKVIHVEREGCYAIAGTFHDGFCRSWEDKTNA